MQHLCQTIPPSRIPPLTLTSNKYVTANLLHSDSSTLLMEGETRRVYIFGRSKFQCKECILTDCQNILYQQSHVIVNLWYKNIEWIENTSQYHNHSYEFSWALMESIPMGGTKVVFPSTMFYSCMLPVTICGGFSVLRFYRGYQWNYDLRCELSASQEGALIEHLHSYMATSWTSSPLDCIQPIIYIYREVAAYLHRFCRSQEFGAVKKQPNPPNPYPRSCAYDPFSESSNDVRLDQHLYNSWPVPHSSIVRPITHSSTSHHSLGDGGDHHGAAELKPQKLIHDSTGQSVID